MTEEIEVAEFEEIKEEETESNVVHGVFKQSGEETLLDKMKDVQEVIRSEGEKPSNFDELPVVNMPSSDSIEQKSPEEQKEELKQLKKWPTLRYPVIEWSDLNVRKMFFSLLVNTFTKYGTERKGKMYYKTVYNYIDVEKRESLNPLKKEKEVVNIMVFDSPKRKVKFSFDMNNVLNLKIHKGSESKIFKLFMDNFDDAFRAISEEAIKKEEELKKDEMVEENDSVEK